MSRSRREVNQENAAHSTGPRTEAGKERSRRNALAHGLTSAAVVLPHENASDYEALKTAFHEQHQPGSDLERELLGRMIDCWWRLQRAYRVEAQFLAQSEAALREESADLAGDAALAALFIDPKESARMRLFLRYLGAAERAWARAGADFERAKKERLSREVETEETSEEESSEFLAAMERYLNAPIGVPEAPGVSFELDGNLETDARQAA